MGFDACANVAVAQLQGEHVDLPDFCVHKAEISHARHECEQLLCRHAGIELAKRWDHLADEGLPTPFINLGVRNCGLHVRRDELAEITSPATAVTSLREYPWRRTECAPTPARPLRASAPAQVIARALLS